LKIKKKCLVIGSNSFSGACYSNYLLEENYDVIACSRSDLIDDVFLPHTKSKNINNFKFLQLDLNKNLDQIIQIIVKEEIPYIANFAAQSMVSESWNNPSDWFNTNVVSTINLHNELRKFDFLEKYVHISTPEVYGNCKGLVDEDCKFNPSTPYAVSRAASDMSLKTFGEAYNFPYVITRSANVYGEHQQLYRIIPRTILFLLLEKKLQLHGGGISRRSFININDVCSATLKIMLYGKNGNSYHISNDKLVSIRSLVEIICKKLDVSFNKNVEIVQERLGKDANYSLDSSKIRSELKWVELVSLENGIDQCINWVKNNFDVLKNKPFNYIHKK
jgi:dTDP-glucose 4,6-dehydratase